MPIFHLFSTLTNGKLGKFCFVSLILSFRCQTNVVSLCIKCVYRADYCFKYFKLVFFLNDLQIKGIIRLKHVNLGEALHGGVLPCDHALFLFISSWFVEDNDLDISLGERSGGDQPCHHPVRPDGLLVPILHHLLRLCGYGTFFRVLCW